LTSGVKNVKQQKRKGNGVNGKPICDFVLVIIVTSAVSATVFEIFTLKDRTLLVLPTPLSFDAPARENPLKFVDKLPSQKLAGWHYHAVKIS